MHSLENYAENVELKPASNVTQIKGNVASVVWDTSDVDALPYGYGTEADESGALSNENVKAYLNSTPDDVSEIKVAILLNDEVFKRIKKANGEKNSTRLSFLIFKKGDLFLSPSNGSDGNRNVLSKSLVISATVHNVDTHNLTEPIVVRFKPFKPQTSDEKKPSCAYWDLSDGNGHWSTRGCHLNHTENENFICHCYHLTNFAIIASIDASGDHDFALSIISMIGFACSTVGLLLTIVTFLVFKQFRRSRGQKVLFNLAISLMAVNIIFVAGVTHARPHEKLCKLVAALLHYFLLVSFAWMLVEGVVQYLKLVKVLDVYVPRFMLKASIPAWTLPAIPVILVASIDHEQLIREKYCWLKQDAFYYAFLLPVGMVILVNAVLLTFVITSITCGRANVQSTMNKDELTKLQVNAGITCVVLMGLTWVFGFLAISDARVVFQYLFCIFNSFQGFCIFIFCNIRERSIRQAWLQCLGRRPTEAVSSERSTSSQARTAFLSTSNSTEPSIGLMLFGTKKYDHVDCSDL